jgi:hypothetical protein
MSDSGSKMGAAGRRQARSEALSMPDRMALTCKNIATQGLCRVVRSVRIGVLLLRALVCSGGLCGILAWLAPVCAGCYWRSRDAK